MPTSSPNTARPKNFRPSFSGFFTRSHPKRIYVILPWDSIGKRYRRQDAIGTPYCITIDHDTLKDNCVTLRNRDTMQQERVSIDSLVGLLADKVSITGILKTL